MRGLSSALALASALALFAAAGPGQAQPPGRGAGAGSAQPGPSQGDLIAQAAIVASHTDPAKWDWPSAASADVRKGIIEGHYTPEELRNIFITLARSSGPSWPNSGPKAANPSLAVLQAPDAINHGRGFQGLEAFYGSNGYGGIEGRVNKIDNLIAHGDRVWITWIIEGRHTGKLFGFPGTGKQIQVRESSMTRFKDGKAVELDFIGDDLALYTQAGGKISFPDKP
ncbi:MAG TPA: ester cyclase [Caulobacteraceae bacterium]|jgi:predicted ester cyclase|nr:ester cyclase [Caulobacteraceae bacterium]